MVDPNGTATDTNNGFSGMDSGPDTSRPAGHPGEDSYEFTALKDSPDNDSSGNLDFILDVPLDITVELGRTQMQIHELLKLSQGSVIELSKLAGEPLEILANNRLIAKGEVVVLNEKYGTRLTEVISPIERIEGLK